MPLGTSECFMFSSHATCSPPPPPPPPFIRYLKPSSSYVYEASISSRTGAGGGAEPPTRNTRTFVHYKAIYHHSDVVTVTAFDSEKLGGSYASYCRGLAHFHPIQIASLHQHSLSHQLLGVRQPFYTKKVIVSGDTCSLGNLAPQGPSGPTPAFHKTHSLS